MSNRPESPATGRYLQELLQTVAAAAVIAFLLRTFCIEVYRVDGVSMEKSLHTDERVLVDKVAYRWIRPVQRGDVIVFRYPRDLARDFVKRVVGLAGDKVQIREGKVYVNAEPIPEAPAAILGLQDAVEAVVPPDSVWVLGDNRENSEDSRVFGEVPVAQIRGVAFLRIWPLTRFCHFTRPSRAATQGGILACQ